MLHSRFVQAAIVIGIVAFGVHQAKLKRESAALEQAMKTPEGYAGQKLKVGLKMSFDESGGNAEMNSGLMAGQAWLRGKVTNSGDRDLKDVSVRVEWRYSDAGETYSNTYRVGNVGAGDVLKVDELFGSIDPKSGDGGRDSLWYQVEFDSAEFKD